MRRSALAAVFLLAVAAAPAVKKIPVELGKEFHLKKGELAMLEDGRATLRVVKFINSPCPKGARCIWSGLKVVLELRVGGKAMAPEAAESPYDALVKDSDYRTYAALVVTKREKD